MKKTITIFFALIILVLFSLGLRLLANSFFNYFEDQTLTYEMEIEDTTLEIDFSKININRKDNYFVAIIVEPPFSGGFAEKGIKTPQGEIINPEIRLIEENGNELKFELCRGGSYGFKGSLIGYCPSAEIPTGKSFKKLLISTDKSIKIKSIIWRGYDTKDLK